ncbi:hypothetical protein [Pseudoxanthomonas indica]|uniref:Uncharacterized protein n=1 Tax=Pseudoxanthomonas indica TaxID=428993 RepID=A0A1T5M2Q5_9GAMM|nr:hypothetical protein [Pseudoxanthomonas indica]GGD60469.1 hypothetical protein GCM10007235_35850 [Pseudoxanthomonas indica]SKC82139.1 hypothetical protein SAMN06296058_3615 [Pseudoxanthomonas indica]
MQSDPGKVRPALCKENAFRHAPQAITGPATGGLFAHTTRPPRLHCIIDVGRVGASACSLLLRSNDWHGVRTVRECVGCERTLQYLMVSDSNAAESARFMVLRSM